MQRKPVADDDMTVIGSIAGTDFGTRTDNRATQFFDSLIPADFAGRPRIAFRTRPVMVAGWKP